MTAEAVAVKSLDKAMLSFEEVGSAETASGIWRESDEPSGGGGAGGGVLGDGGVEDEDEAMGFSMGGAATAGSSDASFD